MCLLITGSSNLIREQLLDTNRLIEDIYYSNADGLGVMYANKQGLKVVKRLPKNLEQARQVIMALPNDSRQVAIHWRMRTHGAINLDQCHPYAVSESTALMHNGVLSTGNAADPTKSDTWHFVKNYLAGVPDDVLHRESFLDMVAEFIGNNRFALMSADGRLSVVNREQGIEHHGVWYSNTYAWSPGILIPNYWKPKARGYVVHDLDGLDDSYGYGHFGSYTGGSVLSIGSPSKSAQQSAQVFTAANTAEDTEADTASDELEFDEIENDTLEAMAERCIYDFDFATLGALMERREDAQHIADYIIDNYTVTRYSRFRPDEYPTNYALAVQAWTSGQVHKLLVLDPNIVAEALLCCCDLTERVEEPPAAEDKGAQAQPADTTV